MGTVGSAFLLRAANSAGHSVTVFERRKSWRSTAFRYPRFPNWVWT
ncbi:hypothetical protein OK016_12010 [Vibrio chagasii]|nr:hypothetical protein [Vibrio chagasii]